MDNCIFCKIAKGEIPCYKVWEDDSYLAFLSTAPHHEGHTLLITKKHIDYFFDLSDQELSEIIIRSKPLAERLKAVFKPKTGKVGLMVAGMGVRHVHVHLIPMDGEGELSFANARHDVPAREFEDSLKKLELA